MRVGEKVQALLRFALISSGNCNTTVNAGGRTAAIGRVCEYFTTPSQANCRTSALKAVPKLVGGYAQAVNDPARSEIRGLLPQMLPQTVSVLML
jgi:hypothetical protein